MKSERNHLFGETVHPVPFFLQHLVRLIEGKSYEAARRAIVAQVGSVQPREKFDDDVVDAVFLRLQENSQVGRYTQADLAHRNPVRMQGEGDVKLYRSAPPGTQLRPGDFATNTRHEAGFYRYGINTIQAHKVKRQDIVSVDGSVGGAQEFVLLPQGYVRPAPVEHFKSFREFFQAACLLSKTQSNAAQAMNWLDRQANIPVHSGERGGGAKTFVAFS